VIVLGLTGSIGMGKSNAAAALRRMGVALFDADQTVHRLLAKGGAAVGPVEAVFSGVRNEAGAIDRKCLAQRVFGNPDALRRLESIIHPMVAAAANRFLGSEQARRARIVGLDIPLLFEGGRRWRCDYVLVVSAPPWVQRQRVMRRPGMTRERFAAILRQQMPDREKQRRADFIVQTGLSRAATLRRLRGIVRILRERQQRRRRGSRRVALQPRGYG
jgi:dephospho-CoA kinase